MQITPFKLKKIIKSGDKESIIKVFEQIYNDYFKLIIVAVSKYIKDSETVKDLAQDVFIAFYHNMENVNDNIKSYLLTSARNISLNYLKKSSKIVLSDDLDMFGEQDNLSGVIYSDLIEILAKFLSSKELEIVTMHCVEGFTFKQIGERLNIEPNTANVTYFRALKKLKQIDLSDYKGGKDG